MRIIYVIYLSLSRSAKVLNILVNKNSWKDVNALIRLNSKTFDTTQSYLRTPSNHREILSHKEVNDALT